MTRPSGGHRTVARTRVLIVDDERQNRQLLEVMLAPEGYELFTAENGADALAIVEQERPHVVLLDVMMPGMDGYQVASRIRDVTGDRRTVIIMLTALDDPSSRAHGLGAGADDFVTKPVDLPDLRARLRRLLQETAH